MRRTMSLLFLMMFTVSVCAQNHTISRSSATKTQKTTDKSDEHKNPSTVRQQKKDRTTSKRLSCPDNNHPHAIDLGLPSGTKWACCNVGANKPEAYGNFYAWGETNVKKEYYPKTYIYNEGTYPDNTYQDIGSSIGGSQYDVAHVKWGGAWQMPSLEQYEELYDNCKFTWTTLNGIKGGEFTSNKNGKSIFLPASGYHSSDLLNRGSYGNYWLCTLKESDSKHAHEMLFYNSFAGRNSYGGRDVGYSVRPVAK